MAAAIPSYSHLYSISDLHLGGGGSGVQMFDREARLAGFIRHLAGMPTDGTLALVLAGDIIDSLATLREGSYIDVDGATELVRSVAGAFKEIFSALSQFLSTRQRQLIVLLGNHDIELAMPEAQEALLSCMKAEAPDRRGRVRFETHGTGFRCQVGTKTVYVTHGNEADRWNHVDHEALRRAAHARALGQRFDAGEWIPNAGTKLVVDVMNGVKKDFPFVDLLKPETAGMMPILAAVDPDRLEHMWGALPALQSRLWAQRRSATVLGESDDRSDPVTGDRRASELLKLYAEARTNLAKGAEELTNSPALLERVRALHASGADPSSLVSDDLANLGTFKFVVDRIRKRGLSESLRDALKDWLSGDRTFALDDEDEVCLGVMSQVSTGIDVVITGHTHLPRWLTPKTHPRVTYLNAGTWARLMALTDDLLNDDTAFAQVFRVLQSKSMGALDEGITVAGAKRRLILNATLAARVGPDSDGINTVAELVRVDGDGASITSVENISKDPRRWT